MQSNLFVKKILFFRGTTHNGGITRMKKFLNILFAAALLCTTGLSVHAEETVKLGVLHSLSGTMAISEVSLRDVVLMAVGEINASGGVLGK